MVTGGKAEEALGRATHLRRSLGFDAAKARADRRPVLLYFHWPHKHATHGKRTTEVCNRVLDEEQVARWALFFRPLRIDMETSDIKLATSLGAASGPSFAVLAPDLSVRAHFEAPRSSAKLVKAMRAALELDTAFAKKLAGAITAQKKQLDAAQVLEKHGRLRHAHWMVERIRTSDVRVDPVWDRANAYADRLENKLRATRTVPSKAK